MFLDATEKEVAVLGVIHAQQYRGGKTPKGFAVLSDKRIYVRGGCVPKDMQYRHTKAELAIDVSDVKSVNVVKRRSFEFILRSIFAAVLVPIFLVLWSVGFGGGDFFLWLAAFSGVAAVLNLFYYGLILSTYYEIVHTGGRIAIKYRLEFGDEIENFKQQLAKLRDKQTTPVVMSESAQEVTSSDMTFCTKCGSPYAPESAFCGKCGARK